jgi:hypothetical protein
MKVRLCSVRRRFAVSSPALGRTRALGVDRLAARPVRTLREVEPPAALGVVHQRASVSREARGRRAVERVDPGTHRVKDVVHVADSQQVPWLLFGQTGQRPSHHPAHLLLLLPERASDRDPVHARAGDVRGRLRAEVLVDAALHDPEEELSGRRVLTAPGDAAVEPPVRALHRARRVVALHVERRALVEGERDVRAERCLDLHRGLRPHEALTPVGVGAKANALLGDRDHHRLAPRRGDPFGPTPPARTPLDLLGNRPVAHREHLVATRVGDDRPPPAHELVEAAELGDQLVARLYEEVVRVAEHHVVAELRNLGRVQRLDGGRGGERHEGGCPDRPVRSTYDARACRAVTGRDLEGRHRAAT